MKHEGMLYKFDCALQASELAADRIKDGSVSNTIANQKPVSVDVGCAVCGVRRAACIRHFTPPLTFCFNESSLFYTDQKNGNSADDLLRKKKITKIKDGRSSSEDVPSFN